MKACPQIEDWEDFRYGRLDGDDRERCASHLTTCADCAALLDRLQAHEALAGQLRQALRRRADSPAPAVSRPGPGGPGASVDDFPGYRILGEVARSQFSIVYEASQLGTGQHVALKVLLASAAADERSRARFEREIELLAGLRHPQIVPIYHSGLHNGQYFFVMPFIRGEPPDVYADRLGLGLRQRVELLLSLCRAVGYAHQRGIMHRDLKPSNLLVGEDGRLHILDFGLAKIIAQQHGRPEASVTLDAGQIIGTPAYMSPEQAAGRTAELDTRCDVYALGVISYRLLLGAMPYDTSAALTAVLQHVQHTAPRRPRAVRRGFDRELEAILLKCLEKEPQRRYHSATALAEDIERHLGRQPVLARGPSPLYVLGKLVARHQLSAGLLAGFLLLLVIFAITVRVQRDRAVAARELASDTKNFLVDAILESVDPDRGRAHDLSVRDMFQQLPAKVSTSFAGQPLVEAELLGVIGELDKKVGDYPQAEHNLRRALDLRREQRGAGHIEVAESMHHLAAVLYEQAKYDEAEPLYAEALRIRRAQLGEDHVAVAETLNHLAAVALAQQRHDDAERLFRQALELRRRLLGDEDRDVARTQNNLARCLIILQRFEEAEDLLREALRVLEQLDEDTRRDRSMTLNNLATALSNQNKTAEARGCIASALALKRDLLGDDHPSVAVSLMAVARLDLEAGQLDGAESACREALTIRRQRLRPDHPNVADTLLLLGQVLRRASRCDEAITVLEECRQIRKQGASGSEEELQAVEDELKQCAAPAGGDEKS